MTGRKNGGAVILGTVDQGELIRVRGDTRCIKRVINKA